MRLLLLLLAGLLLAPAADARMHAPYRGHRIVPGAALLDGGGSFSTSVTGAYSFRKLRSAYAGPAMRLRRASDNAELDIAFLGFTGFTGAPWDAAAAASHCASTTCWLRTWYDQSGLGRDRVQLTAANQPQLIFNCIGSSACIQTTNGTQILTTVATITPATGIVSLSAVGARAAGTGSCALNYPAAPTSNRILAFNAAPNQWVLAAASGTIVPAAADGVWHAGQGVINGASSVLNIDGVETTGTVTGSVVAGTSSLFGAASTTCSFGEQITWDNYTLTPAERTALAANQKSYWGTP